MTAAPRCSSHTFFRDQARSTLLRRLNLEINVWQLTFHGCARLCTQKLNLHARPAVWSVLCFVRARAGAEGIVG